MGCNGGQPGNHQPWEDTLMRIVLIVAGIVWLLGGGTALADAPVDVPQQMIQIESRPGIHTRMIIYRPEHPVATVIIFPDGNGRLEITHIFNTPQIGRSTDLPLDLMGLLLRQKIAVVLMDAPSDHRSLLGVNGWHGAGIFRLSRDHARDVGAAVSYLKQHDPGPIWLAGIRMGAFSAVTAAIYLQHEAAGLVLADGITQCPEQQILLQLCPNGLMGMNLDEITIPTLILSGGDGFPEPLLEAALSHSPSVHYQTFPEFAAFETWDARKPGRTTVAGMSNARLGREMADFIQWNERIHPILTTDVAPVTVASLEVYLAGSYF
jgi:hypothetical protein